MKDDEIKINQKHEQSSREAILMFIDNLSVKYKVDTTKIVVAGFSQ